MSRPITERSERERAAPWRHTAARKVPVSERIAWARDYWRGVCTMEQIAREESVSLNLVWRYCHQYKPEGA
jgi:hypothetical protein